MVAAVVGAVVLLEEGGLLGGAEGGRGGPTAEGEAGSGGLKAAHL